MLAKKSVPLIKTDPQPIANIIIRRNEPEPLPPRVRIQWEAPANKPQKLPPVRVPQLLSKTVRTLSTPPSITDATSISTHQEHVIKGRLQAEQLPPVRDLKAPKQLSLQVSDSEQAASSSRRKAPIIAPPPQIPKTEVTGIEAANPLPSISQPQTHRPWSTPPRLKIDTDSGDTSAQLPPGVRVLTHASLSNNSLRNPSFFGGSTTGDLLTTTSSLCLHTGKNLFSSLASLVQTRTELDAPPPQSPKYPGDT